MATRLIRQFLTISLLSLACTIGAAWLFSLTERAGPTLTGPTSLSAVLRGGKGRLGADEYWLTGPPADARLQDALLPGSWPADARAVIVRASGWPVRALHCGRYLRQDGSGSDDWGMIRFGGPNWNGVAFHRSLPVLPIWPGLAADLAIYALIWWALLGGLWRLTGPARRRRRRRLGQCPKCAYDLLGNFDGGCPECGWNRAGACNP